MLGDRLQFSSHIFLNLRHIIMYTENNIVAMYKISGLCTAFADEMANFQRRKILACIK